MVTCKKIRAAVNNGALRRVADRRTDYPSDTALPEGAVTNVWCGP